MVIIEVGGTGPQAKPGVPKVLKRTARPSLLKPKVNRHGGEFEDAKREDGKPALRSLPQHAADGSHEIGRETDLQRLDKNGVSPIEVPSAGLTTPERALVGLLAVDPHPFEIEVVQEDVSGEDCPSAARALGDYGVAANRAIESAAPAATLLVNAAFATYENWNSAICVKVTGDAAVLR